MTSEELALRTLLPRGRDWLGQLEESTLRRRRSLTQVQTSESHHLPREAVPRLPGVPHPPLPLVPEPPVTVEPLLLYLRVCPSSCPVELWVGRQGTWEPRCDGK